MKSLRKKTTATLLTAIFILSTITIAIPVFALESEVWVDDDGTVDATHFLTIQEGIAAVDIGGTVHVAAGTYNEEVNIGKPLTLLGEDRDSTIIDGGGVQWGAIDITADYVTVSGFTILNRGGTNNKGINIVEDFSTQLGGHHCEISGNVIDVGQEGIRIHTYRHSGYNLIENNVITGDWNGIQLEYTLENTVTGNIITGASGWAGINLGIGSDDNVIENNVISDCKYGMNLVQSQGGVSGNAIRYNKISECVSGIYWQRNPANTIEYNNILDNTEYNVFYYDNYFTSENPVPVENNWWGSETPEPAKFNGYVDYTPCLAERAPMTLNVPAPYATIEEAIGIADTGDTILVYPGIYEEDVIIDVDELTLESTELHGANIKGSIVIGANGVTVDGFYITDFSQIPTPDWSGIYIQSGTGVKVVNNLIDGIAIDPVANLVIGIQTLYGGTASATISNNEIMNVRMGIYLQAFNGGPFTITGNTIEDASHCAVGIDSGGTTLSPVLNGNAFIDSGDMHLEYFGNHIVDATQNYWGTLEPNQIEAISISPLYGLGGVVDYSPWLGAKPGTTPMTYHVDQTGTIQEAIGTADTGDTIVVAAGTYDESINIGKGITLLGANAGIHPAVGTHPTETVGTRGPETILSHNYPAIKPAADDITIDGFKFTGAGGRIIDTYEDANNFHLTNCIFESPSVATTKGVIQFGGGSHTDMLIDFNLFQDQGDHTLYFGGGPYDRLHIEYNKFNVLEDSVFWGGATVLVDGVIEGNEFDGTINEVPGVGFGTINIGQGGNIIIRDNWFHDILYTGFQVGIVGGSVTDNTFERIYPYPGVGADAFQLWGGEWGTPVSTDVLIEGNTINYNDLSTEDPINGIRLRAPASPEDPGIDGSTIHIHDNNFIDGGYRTDAFAIRHQGEPETIVDAEMNYWSTAVESEIIEMFSGPVDYDPWYGKQPKVEETDEGDDTVNATDEADTIVVKSGTGTPTISVAQFTENPEEGFSNDAGKYYDVKIDDDTDVDSLTLRFYYKDSDLGGREESTLSILWHDGTSWVPCSHQTLYTVSDISGYSGYIEVYVAATGTTPLLSEMTGTPFGVEGELPEVADERCDLSVSGDVIVEAAEDATIVYASMGDTAEITVEMDLAGYHGDIHFTLYKKVDGGLAYVDEIRTVYGVELKGSRTADWVVDQNPGNYVVWINIDLIEKVQLTGLDEALHIGPIEVIII